MLTFRRARFVFPGMLLLVLASAAAEPPAAGRTESIGLLVLKSGRFVEGRISQSAGGYVVETTSGSLVVPFRLVEFPAVDRHDAYRIMRNRMNPPTPDSHVALARWCLTHALYTETEAELRTAIELDPRRGDARRMLKRLEAILHPNRSRQPEERHRSPQRTADGFQQAAATGLSGLKPAAAREFVSTIQPILMNKCGNARCHGSAGGNRFRLIRVRAGFRSHRVFVERNLSAVLREIDRKRPSQSRLLTVPRKGHGRRGRAIFFGRSGEKQYQLLRTWTLAVASTRSPGPSGASRPSEAVRSARPTATTAKKTPPRTEAGRSSRKARLSKRVLPPPANDAFDPNVFNRTVQGRAVKKTPTRSGG